LAEAPKYVGTTTGAVVKAIVVDSLHTWTAIQSATNLSEKELNYHLHILFNDQVLFKDRNEYYVVPELEEEYLEYYQPPSSKPEHSGNPVNVPKAVKQFNLFNVKWQAIVILLIISLSLNFISFTSYRNLQASYEELQSQIDLKENIIQTHQDTIDDLTDLVQNLESQIEEQPDTTGSAAGSSSTSSSSYGSSSSSPSSAPRTAVIDKIGTVTRVIDGDTFELSNGLRIRLADIDAPESSESGYLASKNTLSDWILEKTVYLDVDDLYETDRYGRFVCVAFFEDGSNYINVNHALVDGGYADISDYTNEFDPYDWGVSNAIDISEAQYETSSSSSSSSSGSSSSSTSSSYTGSYWASKNSNIYHKPSCYWAKQISSSNRIVFSSESAARAAGYRPCKVCKP